MGEENQEIDQLRAKVIASMSAASNANSKPKGKPIENREEGELSSSEDDGVPTYSVAQPTSVTVPPVEPKHSKSGNKTANSYSSNTAGKSVSGNGPASSGHVQPWTTAPKKKYSKHFGMNPMPSKLGNHNTPRWRVPSGAKNNLVISFSDDDSGSGSEGDKTESYVKKKSNSLGFDGSKKPPISFQSTLEISQRTTGKQVNPKKLAMSRTFTSSMTKVHGASFRSSGPSFVEQGSSVRSVDPANKMVASRDRGNNQGMHGKNDNLESLRQQIAIRENELKLQLKSGQQKETISGSSMDYDGAKLISDAAKKGRLASGVVQLDTNEQDKKRLKLSEPTLSKLSSDGLPLMHIPARKSLSELKLPSVEKNHLRDSNLVHYNQCSKGTCAVTTDPGIDEVQAKGDEQIPISSGNQLGTRDGTSTSCCQSDRGNELLGSLTVFNQSLGLPKITSREEVQPVIQLNRPSSKKAHTEALKNSGTFGEAQSFTSFQNKATCNRDLVRSSEYNELIAGGETLNPSSENPSDKRFPSFSESKLVASDSCLEDCTNQLNFAGSNGMDMESLVKIEELLDRELEEAQDLRHRCEVEERNALKAYRKAQRALAEANARCTYLYQRRELFSAKSRALIMEGSNSVWTSGWDKQMEIGLDSSHIVPESNGDLLPTLHHQMQAEFEGLNQLSHDSTVRCTNGAVNISCQHTSGQNLGSEPCSEPDVSTSELLHHKDNSAANEVCTPSNHPNMSADDDEETFPSHHKDVHVTLECNNKEKGFKRKESDTSCRSNRKYSVDGFDDPDLLEASLRSELFARLGNRTVSKNSHQIPSKRGTGDELNTDIGNVASTITNVKNHSVVEAELHQVSGTGGTDRSKPSTYELSLQQIEDRCQEDEFSFEPGPCIAADPDQQTSLTEPRTSTLFPSLLPPSEMRSAFGHMKITSPIRFRELQSGGLEMYGNDIAHEGDAGGSGNDILQEIVRACSTEGSIGGMGFYSCNLSVDPFWSFCMFELRGKCNDEDCCWQHFKDYSQRNIKQLDNPGSTECHVKPSSQVEKYTGARKFSQHHDNELTPSTYFVASDLLKADFLSYQSVLSRSIGQCWQKGFSISMAVPFSLQKTLSAEVQFFHHGDCYLDVRQGWNRQYMYFQSQDEAMINQGDAEQSLEMALTLSNQDVRKLDAKKKAPFILSRAIETDPTSVALWIVYLHIYYRKENAVGTDDMFSHAIHYNDGSYELWLMYINSRVHLNDRLLAYENALSALCRHASASDGDKVLASAGILDLFLQMMDFLRMSGNVGKAILKIYALLPLVLDDKDERSMLLSYILTCLTSSDRCIFWICCVYLVIYKKLPDAVVQQFDCEKELPFVIDWPNIQLTADEKNRAAELMEMGVNSVASCVNRDLDGKEMAQRSVHLISLCHVRCVAVLDGLASSKILLCKYVKQYPGCLELVLTFARFCEDCFLDSDLKGFEEIVHGWTKETPGLQCIWNQYAESALENGKVEFAKELMVQWTQSVGNVQNPQSGIDFSEDNCLNISLESPSCSISDDSVAFSDTKDKYFGLINLSLHRFLQKDKVGARLAMDKALKMAAPEDFKHCVREHAIFSLLDELESIGSTSVSGIMSLLNRYLVDARSFPFSQPLSRKFIQNIKKPRVRQLINSMLPPIPFDCSITNLVLEVCYGPSLLPEKYNRISDLVDLVEAIMEILPANYFLALSVGKLITANSTSAGIASTGIRFWAGSLLLSSIFQAVPVAPEYIWVEAASVFVKLVEVQEMCVRFHQRALSVYPFSLELWRSYLNISKTTGNENVVIKAANEKGISPD